MFAYCKNNPVNHVDETGCLSVYVAEAVAKGFVSGITQMTTAWIMGKSTEEILSSFVSGFVRGIGEHVFKALDFAFVVWDVGKAVYDTWKTGGTFNERLIVGAAQLYASLSYSNVPDSVLLDVTVKFGMSLVGSAVFEGYQMKHYEKSDDRVFALDLGNYSLATNSGGHISTNRGGAITINACVR